MDGPSTAAEEFDLSTTTIPESWSEAAKDAPVGDGSPLRKVPLVQNPPIRNSVDMFSACVATTAVAIVSGSSWYLLGTNGVTTPWIAVALGVVIAISVRLGGGSPDVHSRAMLSLLFYLATASVVIFLIARVNYADLYGSSPDLADFEQELLHSRLTDPIAILAWFVGGLSSVWTSRLLR